MEQITTYWQQFAKKNQLNIQTPDAWMFGDGSKEMADELAALVVSGQKTGTCSSKIGYELDGEKIPVVGQFDIVLDGDELPVAIIRYTEIEERPMNKVSKEFALSEGEGDLSYTYWYQEHETFFTKELASIGLPFTPEIILVCQSFEVVF